MDIINLTESLKSYLAHLPPGVGTIGDDPLPYICLHPGTCVAVWEPIYRDYSGGMARVLVDMFYIDRGPGYPDDDTRTIEIYTGRAQTNDERMALRRALGCNNTTPPTCSHNYDNAPSYEGPRPEPDPPPGRWVPTARIRPWKTARELHKDKNEPPAEMTHDEGFTATTAPQGKHLESDNHDGTT